MQKFPVEAQNAPTAIQKGEIKGIRWSKEPVWIAAGGYGRLLRLQNGAILCCYEAGGKSWVKRSDDDGKTWSEAVLVLGRDNVSVANPELIQLKNGRIGLLYNQRPRQDAPQNLKFAIGACWSEDGGATWKADENLIFEAGRNFPEGCWEPAAIQLPNGEIQLFFANEFPYPANGDQEISLMRSTDNGISWSKAQKVVYRAGHRDGMPVPLLLHDEKTLVLSIEDNGLAPGYALQPALAKTTLADSWKSMVDGASTFRWGAVEPKLVGGVYVGAPYICKLPSGETFLSGQSQEGGRQQPQMVVYIGDKNARNFGKKSIPVELAPNVGGHWNSLFAKNADTITAITGAVIGGRYGLWAIDGKIERG